MTNPVMVVRRVVREIDGQTVPIGRGCWMWCPGCDQAHCIHIIGEDGSRPERACWDWDGNLDRPTFSPSLLCHHAVHLCPADYEHAKPCLDPDNCGSRGHMVLSDEPKVLGHPTPHVADPAYGSCHSFIRNGRWEFLSDSAHHLAGQTVDMVPVPDWLIRD